LPYERSVALREPRDCADATLIAATPTPTRPWSDVATARKSEQCAAGLPPLSRSMRVRATGPAPVVNSAFGLAMLQKFGWARRVAPTHPHKPTGLWACGQGC
jgi:hypothetical protein